LDGGEPHYSREEVTSIPTSPGYGAPLLIDRPTTVKAIAVDRFGNKSETAEATFIKRPNEWTVKVTSGYSRQYTGGGENAIVDGIRGTTNFASGEWQGIQGKPYEAVVDLQRETEIKEVGASFLQVAGPWIWMPATIEFQISDNGTDFRTVANIKNRCAADRNREVLAEHDVRRVRAVLALNAVRARVERLALDAVRAVVALLTGRAVRAVVAGVARLAEHAVRAAGAVGAVVAAGVAGSAEKPAVSLFSSSRNVRRSSLRISSRAAAGSGAGFLSLATVSF
jgi:hypothetical protein